MPTKDLHDLPFEEGTLFKLDIFEDYAKAWIPTFVMQSRISEIHIFDFFAGPGYDLKDVPGSAIRILKSLKDQIKNLSERKVTAVVHLNEFDKAKYNLLKQSCSGFMGEVSQHYVKIKYYNQDFKHLFPKLLPIVKNFPALVYIDQSGVKYLKYLPKLESTGRTDFLYFVASSYLYRFLSEPSFQKHLKDLHIDSKKILAQGYDRLHVTLTEELRSTLSSKSRLKLYPFSLKKAQNIYGIIFGASHPLAVDKFLNIAWNKNRENGNANFDIDDEASKGQPSLFGGTQLSKIKSFQKAVKDKVLDGTLDNNYKVLAYAYEQGHIGKHAAQALIALKKEDEITFEGSASPCVNYDKVYKEKKKVRYKRKKV